MQGAIPGDYVCHAFPDGSSDRDTYLVGLISVAVSFPVAGILAHVFDVSNEVEMPEGWQEQPPVRWQRLLLGGLDPVRGWNWVYDEAEAEAGVFRRKRPVNAMYMWLIMNADTPLWLLLWGWTQDKYAGLRRRCVPPDEEEDEEKREQEEPHSNATKEQEEQEEQRREKADEEFEEAKAAARTARIMASVGIAGVLVTWTVMVWFILVCPRRPPACAAAPCRPQAACKRWHATAQVYGLEIYSLLGRQAEQAFTSSWGVSYGMGQISEAKDIVNEAAKVRSGSPPRSPGGLRLLPRGCGRPHLPA